MKRCDTQVNVYLTKVLPGLEKSEMACQIMILHAMVVTDTSERTSQARRVPGYPGTGYPGTIFYPYPFASGASGSAENSRCVRENYACQL